MAYSSSVTDSSAIEKSRPSLSVVNMDEYLPRMEN